MITVLKMLVILTLWLSHCESYRICTHKS